MTASIKTFQVEDQKCWQCGAPAQARCACRIALVARPGRDLTTLGYPVRRGTSVDTLRVSAPRCAACQSRNRSTAFFAVVGFFGGLLIGKFAAVIWLGVPELATWGVGVTGFGLVLLHEAQRRKKLGLRSLRDYPPLVTLRKAGWSYPGD